MEGYPRPKRVLDVAVALVLVVLLSPVFALVYVAMALDMILSRVDRGSWLFRERRISRGREFDLLKFRTLRRSVLDEAARGEAHARLHEHEPASASAAAVPPG